MKIFREPYAVMRREGRMAVNGSMRPRDLLITRYDLRDANHAAFDLKYIYPIDGIPMLPG
ncbi:hypothetical protein OAA19_00515 [Rubripirellula sp.]|nr:hypothetical protein [Rubripirellula sp.]MDB4338569.1 hypothetical protein [Rubripirellula sp.]